MKAKQGGVLAVGTVAQSLLPMIAGAHGARLLVKLVLLFVKYVACGAFSSISFILLCGNSCCRGNEVCHKVRANLYLDVVRAVVA